MEVVFTDYDPLGVEVTEDKGKINKHITSLMNC